MCEYLGLGAFKAELEDLCFAVLQPATFRQVYESREAMLAKGTIRSRGRRKVRGHACEPVSMHVWCATDGRGGSGRSAGFEFSGRSHRSGGTWLSVQSSRDGTGKDFAVWTCCAV